MTDHDVRAMLQQVPVAVLPRPGFEDELFERLTAELATADGANATAPASVWKRGGLWDRLPAIFRNSWVLAPAAVFVVLALIVTAVICEPRNSLGCGGPDEPSVRPEPGPMAQAPTAPGTIDHDPDISSDRAPARSPRPGTGDPPIVVPGPDDPLAPGPPSPGVPPNELAFASKVDGSWNIFTMLEDGTGRRQLTSGPLHDREPAWSPDGERLAFVRYENEDDEHQLGRIHVLNADGSGLRFLVDGGHPHWSPNGSQIVYTNPDLSIWVIDADGTDARRISPSALAAADPAWSPRGDSIAFAAYGIADDASFDGASQYLNVYRMRPDGTDVERLTDDPWACNMSFSPDGDMIAYVAITDGSDTHIWTMNADGSEQRQLTHTAGQRAFPHWSPEGRRVVFAMDPDGEPHFFYAFPVAGPEPGAIWEIDADGTELRRISPEGVDDADPVYRPRHR